MNFYIITCDNTSSILSATSYLLNKYWGKDQEFTVLGNHKPKGLPDNFKFIRIKKDDGVEHWTSDLYEFFKNVPEERFILTLDDYLPNDYLNKEIFNGLLKNKTADRICLDVAPTTWMYRISCQPSIWKKEYLLKYLNHNWTPWQFELRGSKYARDDGGIIVGSNPPAFSWKGEGALSGKWPDQINIKGANPEDVDYMVKMGIWKEEDLFIFS